MEKSVKNIKLEKRIDSLKIEILKQIKKGESVTCDFKTNENIEQEDIISFANANGGKIVLGVKENKKDNKFEVVGIVFDDKVRCSLSSKIDGCSPKIKYQIEDILIENKTVVVITIDEGIEKPYMTSGGTFKVRVGTSNRPISQTELSDMVIKREIEQFTGHYNKIKEEIKVDLEDIKGKFDEVKLETEERMSQIDNFFDSISRNMETTETNINDENETIKSNIDDLSDTIFQNHIKIFNKIETIEWSSIATEKMISSLFLQLNLENPYNKFLYDNIILPSIIIFKKNSGEIMNKNKLMFIRHILLYGRCSECRYLTEQNFLDYLKKGMKDAILKENEIKIRYTWKEIKFHINMHNIVFKSRRNKNTMYRKFKKE